MPHGKLTVVVDGATSIISPGVYGMGSSYCTLSCGSQVFNSPTIEGGGSHPRFNTAFEFEIDRTTNNLDVCVYSKSSTRDEYLVGYCKLDFKTVFFEGHTVPLTAFPLQQPSGNSGGQINLSLKFKMRPSPNRNNTHVPVRCSSETPRVVHQVVGRQTVSVEWGCEEKDYRRTQSDQLGHREEYHNLPGTAPEPPPSFVRLNTPKLRKPSPSPNQPIPAKPQHNQAVPSKTKPHVFVQPPVVPPPQNYGYHLAQEVAQGFGEQVAEHLMAETGNQFMAEAGNQVMAQGMNQFMAEAGNQVMAQGMNQFVAEAGNQLMAQGMNQFVAEAGNQFMAQGMNQFMAEAGNQFMAQGMNQFVAEAGNQLMAQGMNQFMAEAGNQFMAQGMNQFMAEAGNQFMAQGMNQFMVEAGNQFMAQGMNQFVAEAGNQFMAEAGNQVIAQAGNQFFAGLLSLGLS